MPTPPTGSTTPSTRPTPTPNSSAGSGVPHQYEAFIAGLPKAELHVHHVGSASPRIVAELAARHPKAGVPDDEAKLAEYFTFTDFAHFITVYLSVVELIRDAEDVRTLTYGVAENMHAQGIRYAELTVTPFSHLRRGIPGEAFMEAIEDARLATERIGHGTSATRDPDLLAHLSDRQIPLEVCPTSNIPTRAVPTLAGHPLSDMVAAGCLVTVNSDDPPMFATDLNREYAVAADLLDLDENGIAALAKNAVTASFAPEDVKQRLTAEIDGYLADRTSTGDRIIR